MSLYCMIYVSFNVGLFYYGAPRSELNCNICITYFYYKKSYYNLLQQYISFSVLELTYNYCYIIFYV